jgi:hypothetical protein
MGIFNAFSGGHVYFRTPVHRIFVRTVVLPTLRSLIYLVTITFHEHLLFDMAPQSFPPIHHNFPALTPRFLPPTNATTLQYHIQIYAIPYGVLGFVSHALTFYVIMCHLLGRRPLLPWQNLEKTTWNIVLVTLSSFISVILSAVTLARTRGSQPLMILAGTQLVLGVIVDAVHVHRLVVKQEGWSNTLEWWAVPMIVTAVFSVWAFYQFPCE